MLYISSNTIYNIINSTIIRTTKNTHGGIARPNVSANDLKTKGVSAIEAVLAHQPEAIISVRGKERFVVMNLEHYHYLRECELESALAQTRADLAEVRFVKESAEEPLARLKGAA